MAQDRNANKQNFRKSMRDADRHRRMPAGLATRRPLTRGAFPGMAMGPDPISAAARMTMNERDSQGALDPGPVPAFSVIVPFHNAAATLDQTLASLRAQTLTDWEAFLIDDASNDGSAEMVQGLAAQDPRLKVLHDPAQRSPRGPGRSRNLGLDRARGTFVAFLDADDIWYPEKLAQQQAAFVATGADIVFSSYRRVDARGRALGVVRAAPRVVWADALGGNPIGCLTAAYRRQPHAAQRMIDLPMHEDYAFWLDLLRGGAVAAGLPQVLADYRVRRDSLSANKLRAAATVWSILGREPIGLAQRLRGFSAYAVNGLRRRLLG